MIVHVYNTLDDLTREQKVRALYERAGTPGEKAAAAEALRRMGVPLQEARPQARAQYRAPVEQAYNVSFTGYTGAAREVREPGVGRTFRVYLHSSAQSEPRKFTIFLWGSEADVIRRGRAEAERQYPGYTWFVDRATPA